MSKKVVGIEKKVSGKTQKEYFMLHTTEDFNEKDKESSTGVKTASEYVPADVMPDNITIGCQVNFYYEKGFQDKAFLVGVQVVASK